ncbi:MAG: hypothetical protein Q4G24_05490 [Paracoccus sp. (in: a-proteobacteria)]|uniref:hypothetical protein n=1 Tax=Paracoccus sp. TaxID=267 RepID=UPI0026DF7203|nr:hypothetical protein [Paracoccus sp. (in: a-proteobacteria)]MDO5620906.1 hypothetical protein [Paracoccus sp. (in: a-proteobacteria)]
MSNPAADAFNAALDAALGGLTACASVMDVAGQSAAQVIALSRRFDCDILVADMGKDGAFNPRRPWLKRYLAQLEDAGIPAERIRVVRKEQDLRPADVVLALTSFGDRWKIQHLRPVLERGIHADSVVFVDVAKGSGAFPFLRKLGAVETIAEHAGDDSQRWRLRFLPNPPAPVADDSWATIARGLAGEDGFFSDGPEGHSFLYVPRSKDVLVVTFDNLDIAMNKRDTRRPWGYEFIEKQGWSMLGVLAGGWTWYRNPWVSAEFDRLRDQGFFKQFGRVVFYGASMGGYAASAFSAACPGADVVAISPQSTLDKTLVPWETRYKTAWDRNFSGPYGDATTASLAAGRVMILYDPHEPLDSGHVRRFTGPNVMKLRCPLLGHRLGSSLSQMGILSPIILGALDGSLTEAEFYRLLRARRDFPRYHKELFDRLRKNGRDGLALKFGRWALARADNRHIRLAMKDMAKG